jgi:hypothetical protein
VLGSKEKLDEGTQNSIINGLQSFYMFKIVQFDFIKKLTKFTLFFQILGDQTSEKQNWDFDCDLPGGLKLHCNFVSF